LAEAVDRTADLGMSSGLLWSAAGAGEVGLDLAQERDAGVGRAYDRDAGAGRDLQQAGSLARNSASLRRQA
jgi:hypothetical protein